MPEMGGIDSTLHIRAEVPKSQQPAIIALTADAFQDNKDRCLKAGMDEVCVSGLSK